jgi:amino acid transporter
MHEANLPVYTLLNGGASVAMWDWIIMSLIYICIAVSLGEIASLYPVSGGVYYWSYMLSPPKHAPLVSWIVGWLSVIGNVVVTLSVNFATTQLILSSVNRKSSGQ